MSLPFHVVLKMGAAQPPGAVTGPEFHHARLTWFLAAVGLTQSFRRSCRSRGGPLPGPSRIQLGETVVAVTRKQINPVALSVQPRAGLFPGSRVQIPQQKEPTQWPDNRSASSRPR